MGRLPKIQPQPSSLLQEPLPGPPILQENIAPPKEEEEPQNQPMSMVQAGLMDFLAESLESDDFTMFGNLPGIMPPPLIGAGKNDFFMTEPLLHAPLNNEGLFEMDTTFAVPNTTDDSKPESTEEPAAESSEEQKEGEVEDEKPEEDESPDYQPRIVQVTNYQAQEANESIKEEPLEEIMQDEATFSSSSRASSVCWIKLRNRSYPQI